MFYIHYLWALSETYRLKVCLCSVWVFCNAETVLIFTFSISSILPPHSPWYFLISLLHPFICTTQSQPESRFTQKEIYPFYIYLFSKTIFPSNKSYWRRREPDVDNNEAADLPEAPRWQRQSPLLGGEPRWDQSTVHCPANVRLDVYFYSYCKC